MARLRVVVQPGSGYELLLSATSLADKSSRARIDLAKDLRRRARAIDGGEALKTLERIGREPFLNLLGFVHAMTDEPTAANAVKAIAEAPPDELVLGALGYQRRAFRIPTRPAIIRDAIVDRDPAAIREFRSSSYPDLSHWQSTLRNVLGHPVEETAAELSSALTRWYEEGFRELEEGYVEADSMGLDRVRKLVAGHDLDSVLAEIVPGITFTREVGQEVVVLTPSVVVRPGWALADYGPALVICYPAPADTDPAEDADARLVLLARALGDELRLQALRELSEGPMMASELARRLGIPRTSIHHHLQILTNAGLVRMPVDDARWSTVELRVEGLKELSKLAADF